MAEMKKDSKGDDLKMMPPHVTLANDLVVEECKDKANATEEELSALEDSTMDVVFNKLWEILFGTDGAKRSIVKAQAICVKNDDLKTTDDQIAKCHAKDVLRPPSKPTKGKKQPLK
ncbi:hypothetical protein S83_022531, partial [Arachis hypogaea]